VARGRPPLRLYPSRRRGDFEPTNLSDEQTRSREVERYAAELLGTHVIASREAAGKEWRVYADGRSERDANLDRALGRLLGVRPGEIVPLIRLLLNSPS